MFFVSLGRADAALTTSHLPSEAAAVAAAQENGGTIRFTGEARVGHGNDWNLGMRRLPGDAPAATARFNGWPNGSPISFTLSSDGHQTVSLTLTHAGNHSTVTYTADGLAGLTDLFVSARAVNSGTSTTLAGLTLDGVPVGDAPATASTGADAQDVLRIQGGALADGFTLTGTITLQWRGAKPQGSDLRALFWGARSSDTQPPEIAFTTPAVGSLLSTATPAIAAIYSDSGSGVDPASIRLLLDGTDRTAEAQVTSSGLTFAPPSPIAEGGHTAEVTVRDRAGNQAQAMVSFTTDTQPPAISFISPNGTVRGNLTIVMVVAFSDASSGPDTSTLQMTFDGSPLTSCDSSDSTALCESPILTVGPHHVTAALRDRTGNTGIANLSFSVADSVPPVVALTSPADGTFVSTSSIVVTGTASDDNQVASVTVNGVQASFSQGGFQATVPLVEGPNEVEAVALDAEGNQATARLAVTVDRTPPQVLLKTPVPGALVNSHEIRVSGQATDDQGLAEVRVQGMVAPISADLFDTTVPLASGENLISVHAVDLAGNETTINVPVSRFDLPDVSITSPADLSFLASTTVDVRGMVTDPAARVTVNGIPATGSGSTFMAPGVPLVEGGNLLTATAVDANGHVATSSINVVRDLTPPRLSVLYPPDGSIIFDPTVTVSGMVNDIVAGTVNAAQATVTVNGQSATVMNRSFVAQGVTLNPGENVLSISASDASGNAVETRMTVRREAPGAAHISMTSGNLQEGTIGNELSQPLVVTLFDANGLPAANKTIVFKVSNTDGSLDGGKRQIAVTTDSAGRASTHFTLGMRAGVGNQMIEASSSGFQGRAVFLETALPGPATFLTVDSGDQQVGVAGRPLPRPLVAVVTDRGHNRLEGVPVKFNVIQGRGYFQNGLQELVVSSDSDGRLILPFTLDPEEGIANNLVNGNIEGVDSSVSFVSSGRTAGDAAATSISGVVLDNASLPIAGVTLRILDTSFATRTDAKGLFRFSGAPVGTVRLVVDGSTVDRPGSWPDLEYILTTIPGRDTTVNMPIYLLPLNLRNGVMVDETHGGTLSLPEIPGFALEVAPGSVTFPGGSRSGVVSVTVVHNDKVPMVPNFGQQPRLIVTIQPAGARFDPPARLTLPNVEGLAPGEVTEMYSFDHDLGHFVSIGPATVSEDGSVLVSNPGVGVLKAGWHCGGDPVVTGTPHRCPECTTCIGGFCYAGFQELAPCHDDGDPCTLDYCAHGICIHPKRPATSLTVRLADSLVAPEGSTVIQAEVFPRCPGHVVSFSAEGEEGSGGHIHNTDRPVGSFAPAKCTTDARGQCLVRYTASPFGGAEKVIGKTDDATGEKRLNVMVVFLAALQGGDSYNLVGMTENHSDNHNIKSDFLIPLIEIANAYHQEFPDASLLNINDISLPRGGLFDINGNWASPHISHRLGLSVDVRSTAIPRSHWSAFTDICTANGATPVLENFGRANEHFHLNF